VTPSQACVDLVKRFEGFRSAPYRCPAGVWTIGYGHTAGVAAGMPAITEAQAARLLTEDLAVFAKGVERLIKVPVPQNQYDALVSFAYNVGLGGLQRSDVLARLNAGDAVGAAEAFGRHVKAKGVVLAGLVRRREAERRLFEEKELA